MTDYWAQKNLRSSFYDGIFAQMFATLTGGVFLTGFALHLGMSEMAIGLLAALPFLGTLFQLPAAHHLAQGAMRKPLCLRTARAARLAWVPLLAVFLLPLPATVKSLTILVILAVSYALASMSFVSWLSWITDLVPDSARGGFFGTRNMLCGAAGMAVTVIFGHLLDLFQRGGPAGATTGFVVVFGAAVAFGMVSLRFIARMSDPARRTRPEETRGSVLRPLRNANFRRFLTFTLCWGFAVNFASPFFTVYFLRELGFDYGFVATLGVLSALADLVGMRVWGGLSDRVKNKPVIRLAGTFAALLPLAWLTVNPGSVLLPVLLHLIGGGFWAGINLCTNNLLLRISEPDRRPLYVSVHSVCGGLGAAAGPILAGLFITAVDGSGRLSLLGWEVWPLQIVFLMSWVLRSLSLLLLARVREPEEATVGQLIRIIRSLRGMSTTAGFNYLLHPFVEVSRDLRGRRVQPRSRARTTTEGSE